MTIEIANRLIKLRKEKGLSQEELADKLGISRQAVSKWERAEASPDTDNLICLAKLYGVSLDTLLNTDEDVDTIVKEQVKDQKETVNEDEDDENKRESVHIGKDGIHVVDGNDEVHIGWSGIHIVDGGKEKHISDIKKGKDKSKLWLAESIVSGAFSLLAITTMIVLGCCLGAWRWSWTFILLIPVVASIPEAIEKGRISHFCYPLLVTFVYLFICLAFVPIWHPLWVVFLSIPVFYSIVGPIDKYRGDKKFKNIVIENKINDKD